MAHGNLQAAIVGATSLRGKDLKEAFEDSALAASDVRLLDEEVAAGTLTEMGGEPAIVQTVEEDSFKNMRFAFFAGSAKFTKQHASEAESAGGTVIDLTGALANDHHARRWIPRLDELLGPPLSTRKSNGGITRYLAPSAAAIVACTFSAALRELSPMRLVIVFFVPVSERGPAGVEELQSQTVNLLSFQTIPQDVFDTQVAFNLLDRWGAECGESFADTRSALDREVRGYLAGRSVIPAMTLVQAPVFFGLAFSVYAEFAAPQDPAALGTRLEAAGASLVSGDDPEPSNVSVAGSTQMVVRGAQADPAVQGGYWFWGAADNLRLSTTNAIAIAEKLLAS